MIVAKDITKIYGMGKVRVHALRGVSLDVRKGEFVAVIGPSGSGKSTLMHILGLLDEPTSGSASIGGVDVSKLSNAERTRFRLTRIGYIFQEYNILPELTALENVVLPAIMLGTKRDEFDKRGRELLREVGLGGRTSHLPSELSGGEQQRVSIARALINEPAILIADEPTANLDTASAMGILNVFKNLNTEHGQTVVMVTHEPEHLKIVDRSIELRDGAIVRGKGLAVETATVKCAHCGSTIFREAAFKKKVNGRMEYFCCEHCMTHFGKESKR